MVAFHLAWAEQNRREAQLLLDYRDAVDGADARAALRERNRPFLAAIADWLYLWHSPNRGDVLDARTGEVLQQNVDLPAIRYADASGVLLAADDGYRLVPYPR